MAEAIVGPVLSKLQEVAVKEATALAAVGGEIDKLRDKLMWLQALVHETDLRSRHDGNRLIRVLAYQIREVSFEAEDAVDKFYLRAGLSGRRWWRAAVELVVHLRTQVSVRFVLSREIQAMNARLEEILDNSTKYGKDNSSEGGSKRWRACGAIPPMRPGWDKECTVPFELTVRKQIKEQLDTKLKNGVGTISEVIPVFGVGGVGKRAFLRHAYDEAKSPKDPKEHFNIFIRVRFPPGIDDSSMVQQIEGKLDRERSLYKQKDNNGQQFCCLVVIDSPLNTATWSKVEQKLLTMARKTGSKILLPVTSSLDYVNGSSIRLKPLNPSESETFFNHVYDPSRCKGTELETDETDNIRKNIFKITGGLPLAIVLLARLMTTMDFNKWEAAANYIMSSDEDSKLQTILSVCIDDLPDELKSCLLFTAGFPEGREIDSHQLVRLWMAEGFLTQHHGLETEQLGQCYLKELIHRGLLQLVSKTSGAHGDDGRVERVAIHDQIHPLLRSEAQRTRFMDIHHGGRIPASGNTRRLALHNYNNKFDALSNGLVKLRTLVSYSDEYRLDYPNGSKHEDKQTQEPKFNIRELFQESSFLRVLNLEGVDVGEKLPDRIGEMVHLKYLGVRNKNLEELPSSVGNLCNLQTIDVRNTKVRKLPKSVWKIQRLRHVLGNGLMFPRSPGDLKLMQTLETVTIKGFWWIAASRTTGKKKALGSLHRLHVVGLNELQRRDLQTVLEELSSVESLSLSGDCIPTNLFHVAAPSCLQHVVSLELHGSLPRSASDKNLLNHLTSLVLESTNTTQNFIDVIAMLPDLAKLVLLKDSYAGAKLDLCTHCPQGFNSLTVLEVSGLATLKKITVPDVTTRTRDAIEPTFVDMPHKVRIKLHKPCDTCRQAVGVPVGPQRSSEDQNSEVTESGKDGPSETSTDQSPTGDVVSFPEIIKEAIKDQELPKTGVKKCIKETYGDPLAVQLEHMVQTGKLKAQQRGRYNYYLLPDPTTRQEVPKHEASSSQPRPAFSEMILQAVSNNMSSKTNINEYIKRNFGDPVDIHLEYMAKQHQLKYRQQGSIKYYYLPTKTEETQAQVSTAMQH